MRCVNVSRGCVDLQYVTGDANIAKTICATFTYAIFFHQILRIISGACESYLGQSRQQKTLMCSRYACYLLDV